MDKLKSVKKPPRRMCPRCHSHNTKFCYINNSSQPRYTCKHCRRCWTHGGRGHKNKRPKIDQPSVSLPAVLALPAQRVPPMDPMEISDGANQEDPYTQNQRLNNAMNKNHNASTSGSREYAG